MVAKVKDTNLETKPFYFSDPHTTFLQLDQEVSCSPTYISSSEHKYKINFTNG